MVDDQIKLLDLKDSLASSDFVKSCPMLWRSPVNLQSKMLMIPISWYIGANHAQLAYFALKSISSNRFDKYIYQLVFYSNILTKNYLGCTFSRKLPWFTASHGQNGNLPHLDRNARFEVICMEAWLPHSISIEAT